MWYAQRPLSFLRNRQVKVERGRAATGERGRAATGERRHAVICIIAVGHQIVRIQERVARPVSIRGSGSQRSIRST